MRTKGMVMGLGLVVVLIGAGLAGAAESLRDILKMPLEQRQVEGSGSGPAGPPASPVVTPGGQAGNFPGFPKTPFQRHQRIRSNLLDGMAIYATHDGYRIFKYLNCSPMDVVYVELAIMDRAGHRVPFAWQECAGGCRTGAHCTPENPLYVDTTGSGRPDVKINQLKEIVTMSRIDLNSWELPLYTFTTTIVPEWVWAKMGPDRRDECQIRPTDRVDPTTDHPLTVMAEASHDLEVGPKGKNRK